VRLIDTAWFYFNEEEIGNALKEVFDAGKVKREDVFIVTKLPPNSVRPGLVKKRFNESLKALQLSYIDLYLIHVPQGGSPGQKIDDPVVYDKISHLLPVWKEMEKLVDAGLVRSIGLSNCNSEQVGRVSRNARIPVAVNQVECHAHFQQKKLRKAMDKLGVRLMSYASLGSPGMKEMAFINLYTCVSSSLIRCTSWY